MFRNSLFIGLVFCLLSCTYYNHQFPYNFERPEKVIRLDKKLKEISGLAYKDENTLYAVQDEKGLIFELNLKSGKAEEIIDFEVKGDYEGISLFQEHFFILKSNGTIYRINESGERQAYAFFDDDKDFDFEGLCLDKESNGLLVACKQHGKKVENQFIWIYRFSLDSMAYDPKPFFKISKQAVHEKFKASAISYNEHGDLFILSANTFTLASFDAKGSLIQQAQLPFTVYPQAEGICFGKNGKLFIASEKGDQERGKILILDRE